MAVTFDERLGVFKLDTPRTSYAFQVRDGRLLHLYWGASLPDVADLPINEQVCQHRHEEQVRVERHKEEYAAWGGYFFDEPALKIRFSDGVRDLDLRFSNWRTSEDPGESETLTITLQDTRYSLAVDVNYRLYPDSDLIDRWAIIRAGESVRIDSLLSAAWYPLEGRGHRLTHLSGRWAAEHRIERVALSQSKVVLESRHGVSGHDSNPWFAIDEGGRATEETGHVWFGALHWSGSWKIVVEQDRWDQVRVSGGYNDFDLALELAAGTSHSTPVFTGGYTPHGFGAASRMLHKYHRDRVLPRRRAHEPRPVIFNSWEVFWFDINADQQVELAERAAALGAEVFVVDDGWFRGRDDDNGGLGDWIPDPAKFPEGILPLSRAAQHLGMTFGIWVEPEMVSPGSELYREHPEWLIGFPTRAGTQVRHQHVLNFARSDVRDWATDWLSRLVRENEVGYLKWDMNRYVTEPGSPSDNHDERVWISYVENLYAVFAELRSRFPELIIENCCSGGGRADFGLGAFTDLVSRSDNGDPLDMLKLHEGYTQVYAAISAGGGVGEAPNGINGRTAPLTYRAHAGMLGAFHVSVNLFTLSDEDFSLLQKLVAEYKTIRNVVHLGDLYRLVSPWVAPYAAFEYVTSSQDRAVVLAFGQALQFQQIIPRLRLAGLDDSAHYSVEGYKPMSGRALMQLGIPIELRGDYASVLIRIERLKS